MEQDWLEVAGSIAAAAAVAVSYLMAVAACLYTLLAVASVRRFARRKARLKPWKSPGVTVLKPLYGAEEGLYEHLLSFCRQSYAGPVQVLFGVHEADDPAAAVARRIVEAAGAGQIEGAPAQLTAELIVDPAQHGANGKISNLINLSRRIENEIVVLADSDILVESDYLDRLGAALQRPGVGAVTCLYRGKPLAGLWSRIGAMGVDYGFLPNVLTGVALKMAHPCIGATIALRRATIEAVGGFEAIKDQLADDYALGEAVRGRGLQVTLADFVVSHAHSEGTFNEVWRRDMRWARTIRSLDPLGYAGLVVTYPLAWAVLALLASGFEPAAMILTAAALLCRMILKDEIDQSLPGEKHSLWLGLARELFSFALFLGSFIPGQVHWRGRQYVMGEDGVMEPVQPAEAEAEVA